MRARWRTGLCQAVVLGLVLLAGCQGQQPPLTQVRGKVWYRGVPVKCGTIVFTPDASKGHRGEPAIAEIQPDGSYQLRTGDAHGAAPGWHRVTLAAVVPGITSLQNHPYNPLPQSILPDRYRDPELSGLRCEVKANQPNSIDFQLE
jgi:hypothetical protein